jgi:integrase
MWFLQLSGSRRTEAAGLHDREIEGDVWTLPAERSKNGREQEPPLTEALRHLLGDREGFKFPAIRGSAPFTAFSRGKRMLDDKIAEARKRDGRSPMAAWRLHDLRRTARSLMSRAGVSSDVAECVLGHALPGVRGVYDRHRYLAEKGAALEKLAVLLERIIAPAVGNVVPLAAAQA